MTYKIEELEKFMNYSGPDRVVHWEEYLKEKEKNTGRIERFSTGLSELDQSLDGLCPGEVVVISGLTGNGKTLFAKTLIRNMCLDRISTTCLSYEVMASEFLRSFKNDKISEALLYIPIELKTGAIPWIEERILEAKVKYNNKIILIDHLHYIVDMRTDKMTQNIGAAMRQLKEIAIKHEQVVLLIAHQEKLKDDKEPGIETLRDSSFVGQEADIVLIVHRIPDAVKKHGVESTFDLGYAVVKIDKARRSGVFKKRITFQKRGDWLEPI